MKLDLAISPCPNDTFIFYHLIQKGIQGIPGKVKTFQTIFADVEELNRRAIEKQSHAITKLSSAAMFYAQEHYKLLNCGGAMGYNCGPLLISHSKKNIDLNKALQKIKSVAIPGQWTTAKLLLDLFLKEKNLIGKVEYKYIPYNKIIPALKNKSVDLGVIIHEERFSFHKQELHAIEDLGDWWERNTNFPIPLGCIAIRKDLSDKISQSLEEEIPKSIKFARKNIASALPFIKNHAQIKDVSIIKAHIDLYVNEFSINFGKIGKKAIQELFISDNRKLRLIANSSVNFL